MNQENYPTAPQTRASSPTIAQANDKGAVSEKIRLRRESHNRVERRRRDLVNGTIDALSKLVQWRGMLPLEFAGDGRNRRIINGKMEKGRVLQQAVDHIMVLATLYLMASE